MKTKINSKIKMYLLLFAAMLLLFVLH